MTRLTRQKVGVGVQEVTAMSHIIGMKKQNKKQQKKPPSINPSSSLAVHPFDPNIQSIMKHHHETH